MSASDLRTEGQIAVNSLITILPSFWQLPNPNLLSYPVLPRPTTVNETDTVVDMAIPSL